MDLAGQELRATSLEMHIDVSVGTIDRRLRIKVRRRLAELFDAIAARVETAASLLSPNPSIALAHLALSPLRTPLPPQSGRGRLSKLAVLPSPMPKG